MYGSGSGLSKMAGTPGLPLPGRLARERTYISLYQNIYAGLSAALQFSGVTSQRGEVTFDSKPEACFSRSAAKLKVNEGISHFRTKAQDNALGIPSTCERVHFCESIQVITGDAVLMHPVDSKLSAAHEASTGAVRHAVGAGARLIQGRHLSLSGNETVSVMVEKVN